MVRVTAVGVALALGLLIVTTSAYRSTPRWAVWAILALALSATAGAVFAYGLDRWRDLSALRPIHIREVAGPIAGLLLASVLLGAVGTVLAPASGASTRGWALSGIAVVGAIPAVATMYGIRRVVAAVAQHTPETGERATTVRPAPGERVALLVASRRLLQGLLAAVGSLVALATLALGSAPAQPTGRQVVLIFGATGSLLVGLAFGPASTTLQRVGLGLAEELLPLRDADDAPAILQRVEDRLKLEQFLGVDRSMLNDLQTGLAILGPLLVSGASTFLPG